VSPAYHSIVSGIAGDYRATRWNPFSIAFRISS